MAVVFRVEVRAIHPSDDPAGNGTLGEIKQLGLAPAAVRTARIFLLQGAEALLTPEAVERIAREVLIDPVTETFTVGVEPLAADERLVEVHLKPGVMDPVATSCEAAIGDLLGVEGSRGQGVERGANDASVLIENRKSKIENPIEVRTGRKYILLGDLSPEQLQTIAKRLLVNESIETGYFEPFVPSAFPQGHPYEFKLTHVAIRELSEEQLLELSRQGHLFLDLREMKAIQDYFRNLQRDPTDAELETLAQTWSEHCVHKTLKATVEFTFADRRH